MKTYTITLSDWEARYIRDLIEIEIDELTHAVDLSLVDVARGLTTTLAFWPVQPEGTEKAAT